MKKLLFLSLAFATISTLGLKAQDNAAIAGAGDMVATKELPNIKLKNLEGGFINSADFDNEGKPIVISFWATWCKPCIQELMTIHENFEQWQEETGVKLIAISIDDARNSNKVAPFVNGKDWPYEVYIDENSDFKRAMTVNQVPHTFLLNANKEIVWDHNSYSPGDEDELYEKIKEVAAGGEVKPKELPQD